MNKLDVALGRLDDALARLEGVLEGAVLSGGDADVEDLRADRNRLAEEVRRLRVRAGEDARLRLEAASAVRDALHDLRGAIGHAPEGMSGNA